MAIPRAFLLIGWLPGSLMLVGVALLTFFTLAVLVQGSAATHASTYGELVWRSCGRGWMRLLQLAVLLFCFGFSVVYLVRSTGWPQQYCGLLELGIRTSSRTFMLYSPHPIGPTSSTLL